MALSPSNPNLLVNTDLEFTSTLNNAYWSATGAGVTFSNGSTTYKKKVQFSSGGNKTVKAHGPYFSSLPSVFTQNSDGSIQLNAINTGYQAAFAIGSLAAADDYVDTVWDSSIGNTDKTIYFDHPDRWILVYNFLQDIVNSVNTSISPSLTTGNIVRYKRNNSNKLEFYISRDNGANFTLIYTSVNNISSTSISCLPYPACPVGAKYNVFNFSNDTNFESTNITAYTTLTADFPAPASIYFEDILSCADTTTGGYGTKTRVWKIDGTVTTPTNGDPLNPDFSGLSLGSHTIVLEVTDSSGTSTKSRTVTVSPAPPVFAGTPASPTFDEVLLSKYYSSFAEGGPEWATDIVRSGLGGVAGVRNINREDYISKYEIQYQELTKEKLVDLRKFAILRRGMARGFRFLAPDDKGLVREKVGVLNSGTGGIERLTQTNGTTTTFYLVKYYEDDFSSYLRRIIKPSPLNIFKVELANSAAPDTITDSFTLSATKGEVLPDVKTGTLSTISRTVDVDFYRGKLTFNTAPAASLIIYVTATYHLPVFFSNDWHKMRMDESAISDFSIGVEEVLPVELGLV